MIGLPQKSQKSANVYFQMTFAVVIAKAPKAKTTATEMTRSENNYLIGWMRENDRAARAARTQVKFFDVVCQTTTWNFQF